EPPCLAQVVDDEAPVGGGEVAQPALLDQLGERGVAVRRGRVAADALVERVERLVEVAQEHRAARRNAVALGFSFTSFCALFRPSSAWARATMRCSSRTRSLSLNFAKPSL